MWHRQIYVLLIWLLYACNNQGPTALELEKPSYYPEVTNIPERNPLTEEGVQLGRQLFYDPILSRAGTISCATCHQQERAFTDGVSLSMMGHSRKPLTRHSPSLVNMVWSQEFFWDGGAKDLESQAFSPLTHPDEMAMNLDTMVNRLNNHPVYRSKFNQAFEIDSISSAYVVRALAQFQRTIISSGAKYDQWKRGETSLTELESSGLQIFESKCAPCHPPPLFTDHSFHNNGLDSTFSADKEGIYLGRRRITHKEEDLGKFKTPTLRNIMLTHPYMHDGRFRHIDKVLDHYEFGVKSSPTLDSILTSDGSIGINFDGDERQALIAFLQTLTDSTLLQNPQYAKPAK